ncbi:hypothetical protein c7_R642 [Megavirus courdo7]|uniref:Uncharacterized protein n=1 Tax=Megavirus courdo7 TaxID=1128135 RepID=H2EBD2_9VIRU|nr:hypothetical protein c7_R642 [Megavirus courdo7]
MDDSNRMNILYTMCLDDKNINALVGIICDNIKLSQRSIPKCKSMIKDNMKKNIYKLNRPPKNKYELKELIKILNKLCVTDIMETITKKYPESHIDKKKHVGKEQMRRELDVWGNRPNHIQDRPYIKPRKEAVNEEDNFHTMEPNDIGLSGSSGNNYADAFGNHLITNVSVGQQQPVFNNPHGQKDSSEIEKKYQQLLNDRNYGGHGPQKPETPDFTLDGSGEKVKQQKLMRKLQEQNNGMGMNGMSGIGGMGGMDGIMGNMSGMDNMAGINMGTPIIPQGNMDDVYASLLGAGAPSQNSNIPFMGMGNPLMPTSSTNMNGQNNMGMNGMNMNGMNGI